MVSCVILACSLTWAALRWFVLRVAGSYPQVNGAMVSWRSRNRGMVSFVVEATMTHHARCNRFVIFAAPFW